jgi:hypothetical protein
MNEAGFWSIIDTLDWSKKTHAEIMHPAIEALSHYSKADICTFYDLLNEKLYALDGLHFAKQLGSNRYTGDQDKFFSADDFLYSRCGVIANGKAFYEEVLAHPDRIPKEFTFEPLLYLPDSAWQYKTGEKELDYFPETWYETFSNLSGWPGIKTIKQRILDSNE